MGKSKIANFLIILVFIVFLIIIYEVTGNLFDNKVNDTFVRVLTGMQNKTIDNRVVLVAIDDKSLEKYAWPWNREKFAQIIDYLENKAKAKVIVLKNLVVFPDTYNPDSDLKFFNTVKESKNLINTYILLNSNISGDIIPYNYSNIFDEKSNVTIIDERNEKKDFSYNGIVKMPKQFFESVKYLSASSLPLDKDEYVRTYMPVVMYNNKFYPSVALSVYAMYTGNNKFVIKDNYLCSMDDCNTFKMPIEIKTVKDNAGNKIKAYVSYYKWKPLISKYYAHKTYSASDILEKIESDKISNISDSEFRDKIVIIGLNASDNRWMQTYNTPVSAFHSDIDIQATMINNMLDNSFKTMDDKDYTPIITTIFCFFILRGFKNIKINLVFTTILSCLYIIYYMIEYLLGIYVAPVSPVITMYLSAIFKSMYSVLTTDKTVEMMKHALGKYISKDVMDKVISNLDKLNLGGTRTVVTIFFVDIRNFTKIAEELPPQEVTSILNEYFSTIEPVIAKYHGIVNKYIGDGLLAVFGEPVKNNEHALNAVLCGIEIIDKIILLREKFIKENKPLINIGIGVNTGEVFAGNIGTEERLEYTVIGDNVNLASRIEAYNQILKTQFLISEYTYEYVKDKIDVVKLSGVNIKGKSKPIDIYEVLRFKNGKN